MTNSTNYFTPEFDIFCDEDDAVLAGKEPYDRQLFLSKYVNRLFKKHMFSRFKPKKTFMIVNVDDNDITYFKGLLGRSELFDILPAVGAEVMPIWADFIIDLLSIEGQRVQLIVQKQRISVAITSGKDEDTKLFYYKKMWSYQDNGEL